MIQMMNEGLVYGV